MKTQPKMKTTQATETPTNQANLRRQQIETLRTIMLRVLSKLGPMTAGERRSSKRKSRRTKKAE